MPDPMLYLKGMGAAAIVSAVFVLVLARVRGAASTTRINSACVLGIGFGLLLGCNVLSLRLAWPPMSALDRFLIIVVPAALTIELIAGFQRVPRGVAWLLRMSLAATIPRILLHGSVYLSGKGDWTFWQAGLVLLVCSALLAVLWCLLSWLSQRSPGVSIPLSIILTIQCAGLTVMMAGYIKGGTAAFLFVASLLAATISAKLIAKRSSAPAPDVAPQTESARVNLIAPAILGIGVVSLCSLLCIGNFFGRLSTGSALVMLLAPLLCWVTEIPLLRNRKPWIVGSIRLILVAIPLVVVLVLAKRDFDRDMAPLLGWVQESTAQEDQARH